MQNNHAVRDINNVIQIRLSSLQTDAVALKVVSIGGFIGTSEQF
jgi:hypothetical protein